VARQRGLEGRCTSSGSEEADGDAKKSHGGWGGGTGWYAEDSILCGLDADTCVRTRFIREKLRAIWGYVERVNLNTAYRTDTDKLYLCVVVVVILSNTCLLL